MVGKIDFYKDFVPLARHKYISIAYPTKLSFCISLFFAFTYYFESEFPISAYAVSAPIAWASKLILR